MPLEDKPLISVITVTYNAQANIVSTLESVSEQSYDGYEHIIMDGASKDATLLRIDNLKTPLTRVFSSPDNGIYDAMNKALGEARGDYVIFLNSGDRFFDRDTLKRYAQAIEKNNFPGIVYGQTVLVDENNNILGERHLTAPENLTLDSFKDGMMVCHQAFMVLRKIVPLYDTKYRFSSDYEWCIRCLQHSKSNIYLEGLPVARYLSEGVTTNNHLSSLIERFDIMSRYYGFFNTLGRHSKFMFRYISRRKNSVNKQ